MTIRSLLLGAVCLVLVSGCTSPVPPSVSWGPATIISGDPAVVLAVQAASEVWGQRSRIEQSLRDAGVTPASGSSEAKYALQVKVGKMAGRGHTSCGRVRNVAYVLSGDEGRILVIKGRGPTGTCTPNIFDDMSQRLASFFR